MQATSSGDAVIGTASSRGLHAAVLGTQQGSGNFQRDPFGTPLPAAGLEANFYAYKNTLTLAPT